MSRIYSLQVAAVSVAAAQDLISVLTNGMAFSLHEVVVGQTTGTTIQNLGLVIKRQSGTVTPGSGGTAVTPQKMNNGDAVATVTARANDTTASSATTTTTLRADVYNSINTYQYLPPPEDRPVFAPGQQLAISLTGVPAAAQSTSITVVIEELF